MEVLLALATVVVIALGLAHAPGRWRRSPAQTLVAPARARVPGGVQPLRGDRRGRQRHRALPGLRRHCWPCAGESSIAVPSARARTRPASSGGYHGHTGALARAERAAPPAADRQNLIRVMPAKGGVSVADPSARRTSPSSAAASSGSPSPGARAQRGLRVAGARARRAGRRDATSPRACSRRSPRPTLGERDAARARPAPPPRAGPRSPTSSGRRRDRLGYALRHARRRARPRRGRGARPRAGLARASSACASSGCCRARRGGSSPRWRRRCASRSRCPTTTSSTRAALVAALAEPRRARRRCAAHRRERRADRASAATACAGCAWPAASASPPRTSCVAAGAWSGAIAGSPDARPVRPVKGQILRLRDPAGPGLLERVVRFEGGYLVPRGDGRYVLGATMEERGFDTTVTAGGALRAAARRARARARRARARGRGDARRACGPARPTTRRCSGRGRVDGLHWADRPLPQRHPARAGDGRAASPACSTSRCRGGAPFRAALRAARRAEVAA